MADSIIDPRITSPAPRKALPLWGKSENQNTDTQPTRNQIDEKPGSGDNKTKIAIDIQNGFFGWAAHKPVLKNLNIRIERSVLTLIVGPVACGKSTLLKALLGELPYSEGSVHFLDGGADSVVALCDQTPWLLNSSVRDNITSFLEYDAAWYQLVTNACALENDFKKFPCGDQSVVGSNGITLSGGQKQRVVGLSSSPFA